MATSSTSPLSRAADSATRLGAALLALAMGTVLLRFLLQADALRPFTAPLSLLFFLFGFTRPRTALYPLIFAMPLAALVPFIQGVANFSLIEIAWWSVCIGRLVRRALGPRTPPELPPGVPPGETGWPVLTLLTVVICSSAAVRLALNFLWADPLVWQILWQEAGDFFRWEQSSRLFPLRAAAMWLEGVAFFALVRRGAWRDGFQRRVRGLLIISLTFVVLTSLHQFALGLMMGPSASESLEQWQLQPDWLPVGVAERWPGLRAVHGLWPDVNSFASYLLMALPLVLSIFVLSRSIFARALLLQLGVLVCLVLLLTFSRIAWIWLPIVLLVWSLLTRGRARRLIGWLDRGGRLKVLALSALLLLVVGLACGTPQGQRAMQRFFRSGPGERANVLLKGRLSIWERALKASGEEPLFGIGHGAFFDRSGFYYRYEATHTAWGEEVWNPRHENAHNQYLQLLVEDGLLGLALAGLALGQWAAFALRVIAFGRLGHAWLVRGILTSVFALGGTLLTGHALLLIEMLFLFWTLVALSFVSARGVRVTRLPPVMPSWSGRAQVALVTLLLLAAVRLWHARGAPELLAHGVGLYDAEQEASTGLEYQWTRDRATLLVRNIQGEVAFFLSNARPDQDPVDVEVRIDGRLRGRVTPPDYHWWPYRYRVDVPPNAVYRLELRVLETYHNEFDPPDKVLGIRFRGLSY